MARTKRRKYEPVDVEKLSDGGGDFELPSQHWKKQWTDYGSFHELSVTERVEAEQVFAGVNTEVRIRWDKRWQDVHGGGKWRLRKRTNPPDPFVYNVREVILDVQTREAMVQCVREREAA